MRESIVFVIVIFIKANAASNPSNGNNPYSASGLTSALLPAFTKFRSGDLDP